MLINVNHRIWEAAVDPRWDERPVLLNVSITRSGKWGPGNGVAVAANGFMFAVVPVQFEEGDEDCLVYGLYLKEAVAQAKKLAGKADEVSIGLGPRERDSITVERYAYPKYRYPGAADLKFPNWETIVPPMDLMSAVFSGFAFNLSLLGKATRAIGADANKSEGLDAVVLQHGKPSGPIVLMPATGHSLELRAPFAVLMPMHATGFILDAFKRWEGQHGDVVACAAVS